MDEREKLKVCRDADDPDLYVVDPRISMRMPISNGQPDG
jgi:hypothetical protein